MSQPQLYRKPATPGYLGGYNWPAVALGLLVLVLANFFVSFRQACVNWRQ
jgi:hypothetical protein